MPPRNGASDAVINKTKTRTIDMKSITSILAALALGTAATFAADPAKTSATDKPTAAAEKAAKPDAANADKPKRDPAVAFKKLDTNNDNKISAEEYSASPMAKKDPAKATETFGKRDKDGDKSLSLEEFSAQGKKKKE
jgi:hypothetical protein